jgi:putative membrane protein
VLIDRRVGIEIYYRTDPSSSCRIAIGSTTTIMMRRSVLCIAFLAAGTHAFRFQKHHAMVSRMPRSHPLFLAENNNNNNNDQQPLALQLIPLKEQHTAAVSTAVTAMAVLMTALPADAAADTFTPIASALAAYVHYTSLLVGTGCLVTERLLIKPNMSPEEEKRLVLTDALWGVSALTLAVSGYYRTVEYGKGWEFYAHEPLFWVKLVLAAVMAAASFFPTTIIIKRALEQQSKEGTTIAPLSEALAARMTTLVNAQLLAMASIPLAATLMSRGVLYAEGFPWQAGAGLTVLTLGGLGFKYAKEALEWNDDDDESVVVAPVVQE